MFFKYKFKIFQIFKFSFVIFILLQFEEKNLKSQLHNPLFLICMY